MGTRHRKRSPMIEPPSAIESVMAGATTQLAERSGIATENSPSVKQPVLGGLKGISRRGDLTVTRLRASPRLPVLEPPANERLHLTVRCAARR